MKTLCAILIALPLAAQQAEQPAKTEEKPAVSPAPDTEKKFSGSVTLGYRALGDIRGNSDVYRSIVNLGEGVRLLDLDLRVLGGGKLFDRLDLRASSWGGDPYNSAALDLRKQGVYRLNVDYRNIAYFSFLPSFANPGLDRGVLLSQRAYDTRRRLANAELELRPGSRIVPYLAFTHDSGSGRGVIDFVSGANEYPVATDLRDQTDNYRGGVHIELPRAHVTLEQGGLTFKDDQRNYTADRNLGNRTTPVSGQRLFLTNLNQAYGVRGDSIFTRALFTASPTNWADLRGQLLYSRPETDVHYVQGNTGLFVAANGLTLYSGQLDLGTAQAELPRTSGDVGFEVRPFRRLRVLGSWKTSRYHVSSAALLSEQFLSATSPTPAPVSETSARRPAFSYNQEQVDLLFDLTRRLTVRAGQRFVWGESLIAAGRLSPVQEERGELRQHVALAGLTYRLSQKLSANFDAELAKGDRSYFRTSLHDYERLRGRLRYRLVSSLDLAYDASMLHNQNPALPNNYEFRYVTHTLHTAWRPAGGKRLTLWADYTRSTLRSDLDYFDPQDLVRTRSFYRENAHTGTALLDLTLPAVGGQSPLVSLGGSFFSASGSRPTNYYQPIGKFVVPIGKNVQWFAEWRWWGYGESFYAMEGFRNHQVLIGLKLAR